MILVLLGPPGSGKGTQAAKLVTYLDIAHLSTGDVLRQAVRDATPLGQMAASYMESGHLVPDETVVNLVGERLVQPDCASGCLLDGFPRSIEQAESLHDFLDKRRTPLNLVIEIQVADEELQGRMLDRAQIEGRSDDTPETIAKRFDVYRTSTQPLVEYYTRERKLKTIDGMGTPQDVFQRIRTAVDQQRNA